MKRSAALHGHCRLAALLELGPRNTACRTGRLNRPARWSASSVDPGPLRRRARGHDPAARAVEGELLISVALHRPDVAVHQAMVVFAKKDEVGEVGSSPRLVGWSLGFPLLDVVYLGEGHVGTAREATTSVPAPDLPALGGGRETP